MMRYFKSLFQADSRRSAERNRPRLEVEALQDRIVPSVTIENGDIHIHGTDFNVNDTVHVFRDVRGSGDYFVYEIASDGNSTQRVNWRIPRSLVTGGDIFFWGYSGDDVIRNYSSAAQNTGLRLYADGGNGRDALIGGSKFDRLYGGPGHDKVWGYGSGDHLFGDYAYSTSDDGKDTVYGGFGNDYLHGGFNVDTLYGEGDNDVLNGQDDGVADILYGGAGRDAFQEDWHFYYYMVVMRDGPTGYWWNDDWGRDFNPDEDRYYNPV